jgi:hypothetical protein
VRPDDAASEPKANESASRGGGELPRCVRAVSEELRVKLDRRRFTLTPFFRFLSGTNGLGFERSASILRAVPRNSPSVPVSFHMAGLEHAKAHGTKSGAAVGRPHAVFDRAAVVELRTAGRSWREIASALGVSTGTARTVFNAGVQKPPRERRPSVLHSKDLLQACRACRNRMVLARA